MPTEILVFQKECIFQSLDVCTGGRLKWDMLLYVGICQKSKRHDLNCLETLVRHYDRIFAFIGHYLQKYHQLNGAPCLKIRSYNYILPVMKGQN